MSATDFSYFMITTPGNYIAEAAPRFIPLITSKDYATITAAGYTNRVLAPTGRKLMLGDMINAFYAVDASGAGTNAIFTVAIDANGVVTLAPFSNINEVTFVGNAVIGNLVKQVDLAGNIEDAGVDPTFLLQSDFANPDVNINQITDTIANISNANIVSGVTSFTPAVGTTYQLGMFVANVNTSFAGGSNNSTLVIQAGSTDILTLTSTALKAAAQGYALGQVGFTYTGLDTNITSAAPLKIKADAASDYTSGVANIRYTLIRTA